jgi:biotin-dependent carboxylase-like uncharacterized protein
MNIFRVIEPGPMTLVQDIGRYGFQQFGVPVSGALDQYATRVANMLVGNSEDAAVLEITFMGPKLEVLGKAEVAITGADMRVLLNGEPQNNWTAFRVNAGDILAIKPAKTGVRAYLAATGGIEVPVVMGSRSTYMGAKFGGYEGRPLAKDDVLARGGASIAGLAVALPQTFRHELKRHISLRAIPGPQDDFFDEGLRVFYDSEYKVTTKVDRMGYRLQGPTVPLKEGVPKSIISEPSLAGAVQIPPDGQPIILLVEQTVGGYVKIATVLSSDLPMVAQARPDDVISFVRIDLEEGQKAVREAEQRLDEIRELCKR